MNRREPSVGEIARAFLHLGLTAFGGLAMLEPMRRMTVDKQGWLGQEEFMDGLALCQLLPGATVVQLGTYIGYRLRRVAGAFAAAGAFILPAFIFMLALSFLYFTYTHISWVQAVSRGMGAVVIALLLQTLWRLGQAVRKQWLDAVIALLALAAFWLRVNFLLVFLLAGLLRMALGLWLLPGQSFPKPASPMARPRLGLTLALLALVLLGVGLAVWGLGRLQPDLARMTQILLKIGVVSFGGGFVMIPILQWEVVNTLSWLTLKQFMDGILLSFITPGPIIILATFVGYRVYGLLGAVVATLAIFLPPILMIIFLTPYYQRLKEARWMRPAIQGILAALVGMLALVTLQMGQAALIGGQDILLTAATAIALMVFEVNLLWIVPAVVGLSLFIF
ncbi:MAG: chromate efflux transporter [Desulfobaccales bacterium]